MERNLLKRLHFNYFVLIAIIQLTANISSFAKNKTQESIIKISGQVVDSSTGSFIPNVSIYVLSNGSQFESNEFGFYSISIKKGSNIQLLFNKEGYRNSTIYFTASNDTFSTVELNYYELAEINVTDDSLSNHFIARGGLRGNVISSAKLNSMPLLLGEKDVARSLQYLPGVQVNNEASTGINVRGGSQDQNSYLIDDVPIYNISHLFGFASALNSDIIKEAVFYKGDFPARFGDKLSSVCNIRTKDGDENKYAGGFTINPIVSKVFVEGPISKENLSFIVSARRTFLDLITTTLLEDLTDYDRYHFYDVNFKLKWKANRNNRFYFSLYNGNDSFSNSGEDKGSTREESGLHWRNTGISLRWNSIISSSVFSNVTFIYSDYTFLSEQTSYRNNTLEYASTYKSDLRNVGVKVDLDYTVGKMIKLRFGGSYQNFVLEPGAIYQVLDTNVAETTFYYTPKETSFYSEVIFNFSKKLHLNLGLRGDYFQTNELLSKIQTRASLDFDMLKNLSLHAGFNETYQPIHQLSNTYIGVPTDLWVPALSQLPPEHGTLYSAGLNAKIKGKYGIAVDGYYKKMKNIVDYKPGSTFLSLSQDPSKNVYPDWTQNVVNGTGESYGTEIMFEKVSGRLTGWISYTLSWSKRVFEEINFGNEFYPSFDRRHNLSVIANYRINRMGKPKNVVEFSSIWTFSSANPVTLPSGEIRGVPFIGLPSTTHTQYVAAYLSTYNSYLRLMPYHRLDVAIRLIRQDSKRTWEFGIYNVYNRANPFYYYTIEIRSTNSSSLTLMQKSYFSILPYLSYAIKF